MTFKIDEKKADNWQYPTDPNDIDNRLEMLKLNWVTYGTLFRELSTLDSLDVNKKIQKFGKNLDQKDSRLKNKLFAKKSCYSEIGKGKNGR